jgi:hypothetical protein
MPHRKDGPMERMQAPAADSDGDRLRGQAARPELVERQHAPLLRRGRGDPHVRASVDFAPYRGANSTLAVAVAVAVAGGRGGHPRSVAARGARNNARL